VRYAFVDGAYLLDAIPGLIEGIYDEPYEIEPSELMSQLRSQKVFFYDAIRESSGGLDASQQAKLMEREHLHERLSNAYNYHVREGSVREKIKKGDKPEQKEVDVYLAVEAMTHVYRHNAEEVSLLTGDSDFIPLVRELVQMGAIVNLFGKESTPARLRAAADNFTVINYAWLWHSAPHEWKERNPLITEAPVSALGNQHSPNSLIGYLDGSELLTLSYQNTKAISVKDTGKIFMGSRVEDLKRYMRKFYNADFTLSGG